MKTNLKNKLTISFLMLGLVISILLGISLFNNNIHIVLADTQSDLNFSLINDNSSYKVTALNKNLTNASIPTEYNGLPVTEIGDSAFSRCANLENIFIPNTITRIGTNAFAACSKLKNISGLSNVKEIGNNAFANCPLLDKVILPDTLETLGSGIFRNYSNEIYSRLPETTMESLNAYWKSNLSSTAEVIYGNNLVYVEHFNEENQKDGYEIKEYQNINIDDPTSDEDKDFEVLSSYEGLPVLNIHSNAFFLCKFRSLTIKHDETETFSHSINISDQAFTFLDADYVNIEVDVSFYQNSSTDVPSSGILQDSSIRGIKLPSSLTTIPESMFLNCINLQEIGYTDPNIQNNHLSDNIMSIGKQAFEGCTSLHELYIPSSVVHIGNGAFNTLGDNQVIYLDLYQPGSSWDSSWKGTTACSFEFKPISITFCPGDDKDTTEIISFEKSQLSNTKIPINADVNFKFKGYYTERKGAGVQCFDENMNITELWNQEQDALTLYAYWVGPQVYVTLITESDDSGNERVKFEYGDDLPPIEVPSAKGKIFQGYYTELNGQGLQYYNADGIGLKQSDLIEDTNLYAKWECIIYDIQYYLFENSEHVEFPNEVTPSTYTVEDKVQFKSFDYKGYMYEWNHQGIPKGSTGMVVVIGTKTIIDYSIEYRLGGGVNSDNPSTYNVENAIALKNPKHRERGFKGWTLNGQPITTLVGLTGNITLVANWSDLSVTTLNSSMTNCTVTGEYSKIILPYANFTNQCFITVANNVKQLYVESGFVNYTYNISIIKPYTSSLNLCLDNVSISGPAGLCPIGVMGTLNLYTYGKVNIYGGDGAKGENGAPAMMCSNLTIHCADNLRIEGGDGGDDLYGDDFGNAGCAILITGYSVRIDCGNVAIVAGYAGSGFGGRSGADSEAILSMNSNSYLYVNKNYNNIRILSSSQRRLWETNIEDFMIEPGLTININMSPTLIMPPWEPVYPKP